MAGPLELGLELGRLSIGTAPLGGLYAKVPDAQALATLEVAAAGGVTHFDTAPHYGRGLAEERLGAFFSGTESEGGTEGTKFTVSTKVGRWVQRSSDRTSDDIFLGAPPGQSVFDFAPDAIRAQLDESRRRLRRDFIDIVFIHDPDDHLEEVPGVVAELSAQRDAGLIGAIGVGTNSAAVAHQVMDLVRLDVVLLAGRITLLENSGESVAERCVDLGVAFLAAGVFQSGILTGASPKTYDYRPADGLVRHRVAELEKLCDSFGVGLAEVAINHPRRFRGVTTTLVGVRSPAEATFALEAMATDHEAELWDAVDELRQAQTERGDR